MSRFPIVTSFFAAAALAGCATPPMGPTVRVMPAPGKPFEVFAGDQATCKEFASGEVNGGASLSNLKQLGTAALGAALGAGAGAGMGAAAAPRYPALAPPHNPVTVPGYETRGAEAGGSMGALAGVTAAARGSAADQSGLQGRYDLAYSQCMYARGNQVAGIGPADAPGSRPPAGYGVAAAGPMQGGPGAGPIPVGPPPAGFYPQGPRLPY